MLKRLRTVRTLADHSKRAIADRLRWAREALGYTEARGKSQRQYAIWAGLEPNSYNQCERAKNRISIEAAIRLCERHKLTLDYIYRGELSNIPQEIFQYVSSKMRPK